MNPPEAQLQALRSRLSTGWPGTIARSVGATSVRFITRSHGEFAVEIVWGKADQEVCYVKEFTRAYCMGASANRPPLEQHVQKRACDYAREIIQEILKQRGAL